LNDSVKGNIIYVYISGLIPAILTFVFWIIVSNLFSSEVIGTVATLASFAMILGSLSGFSLVIGMNRYLGKVWAENDLKSFKNMSVASILFSIITSIGILGIFLNPLFDFPELMGINDQFVAVIIAIVIGNAVQNTLRGVLISSLKSKRIVLPSIIASFSRFPVLFLFIYIFEFGENSIPYVYSSFWVIFTSILLIICWMFLRKLPGKIQNVKVYIRIALKGALPKWIPEILNTLGNRLSIITVFAFSGASETGLTYIPFAIFSFISLIPGSVNQVTHPFWSGLTKYEKQVNHLRQSIKMAFFVSLPIAAILYFYAKSILSIFGSEYSISDEILGILLIAFPFAIIGEGIYYFLHSREKYKKVLFLGLVGNLPRIFLYFLLVPEYGGIGAAIAFSIGFIIQMIFAIIFLERKNISLQYGYYTAITAIPIGLGFVLSIFNFGVSAFPIILIGSWVLFARLNILKESDLENFLGIIFDPEKSKRVNNSLIKKLKQIHIM